MQPSNCLCALDRRGLALANCPAPKALLQGDTLSGWWKIKPWWWWKRYNRAPGAEGSGAGKMKPAVVLTRKRDYTSLWAPSFFLRGIPLHVYQRFSWGQNPVNERPLRLRRKGKMLWHLQQRADPSRPRAEKYTIEPLTQALQTHLSASSFLASTPLWSQSNSQVVSPNGSSTCMGRLPRLKPGVFMLQVHAMHVTCRATACAQVPGCRRGQAERRSPECAMTALCARSSNELTKKAQGARNPTLLAFKVKGAFRTGIAVEVYVACSACAHAGISFYHSYIYIYSTSIMFHQRTKSKHGVLWHCRAPPRWGPHPPMRRWWWRTFWRWSKR